MLGVTELTADPQVTLPPPHQLRAAVAKTMRDLEILNGLLRLSERIAKRDGLTPAAILIPDTLPTTDTTGAPDAANR